MPTNQRMAALRFELPPEVADDPVFDTIMAAVQHLFDGADPARAAELETAVRAARLPAEPIWVIMVTAVTCALATYYVQRDRPAVPQ